MTWDVGLYHYTCEHGAAGIAKDGFIRAPCELMSKSQRRSVPIPEMLWYSWFTDLDTPIRDALGLTSHHIACDRTTHRFQVRSVAGIKTYLQIRRDLPVAMVRGLEVARGVMPRHWFMAQVHIPVVLDDA